MYYTTRLKKKLICSLPVVLAEHSLIKHFLDSCIHDFYNGLRDNYSELFGDSILFADAQSKLQLRLLSWHTHKY